MSEWKLPLKITEKPNALLLNRKGFGRELNVNNIFEEGKLLETELGVLCQRRDDTKVRLNKAREKAERLLTALDHKLAANKEGGLHWAGEEFLYGIVYVSTHNRLERLDDFDYGKSFFNMSKRGLKLWHGDYDYDRKWEKPFVSLSDREIAQRLRNIGIKDMPQEYLKDLMTLATQAYDAIEATRKLLVEKIELDREIWDRMR